MTNNLLQILMMLPQLITTVEQIMPQPGSGPAKSAVVQSAVAMAVPPSEQPQVMPQIQQWITMLVLFANMMQVFKTAQPMPQMPFIAPTQPAPSQPPVAPVVDVSSAEHMGQPHMVTPQPQPFTQA